MVDSRYSNNCIFDKRCQVFTPDSIVDEMLDVGGYIGHISGKKVLENSFGNGAILCKIVERYVLAAVHAGCSSREIKTGLEEDIWGIEIDKTLYKIAVEKLNKIVAKYDIENVKWSLFSCDALLWDKNVKFDFVIGNPPYISYRFLSTEERSFLRSNFKSCRNGCFDYCYAFIEKGILHLKESGKLVQLVPISVYKNRSAELLRKMLLQGINTVVDYSSLNIFGQAMVASTVFVYTKGSTADSICYLNKRAGIVEYFQKQFFHRKWVFENCDLRQLDSNTNSDVYDVFVSVATQLNSAFVVDRDTINNWNIESDILRRTISPRYFNYSKELFIIFPYKITGEQKIERYTEFQFQKNFPYAAEFLRSNKLRLENRDADQGVCWFEYGRSQAIKKMNKKKLLLSAIVTDNVKVRLLDEEYVPYSGICVTANNLWSLKKAKRMLESEEFLRYARKQGIPVHGNSVRISSKDVKNWIVR